MAVLNGHASNILGFIHGHNHRDYLDNEEAFPIVSIASASCGCATGSDAGDAGDSVDGSAGGSVGGGAGGAGNAGDRGTVGRSAAGGGAGGADGSAGDAGDRGTADGSADDRAGTTEETPPNSVMLRSAQPNRSIHAISSGQMDSATSLRSPQNDGKLRKLGSITQECWDVLLVDPTTDTLRFIRFGAGNDRIIEDGVAKWA
jgi:hypothetical protein